MTHVSRVETCMGNFLRETAGNTAGVGIKFETIPWGGNLIGENPAVVVGRITSRPAGRTLEERRTQLSADSVDSLLFLHSAFDDKFYRLRVLNF